MIDFLLYKSELVYKNWLKKQIRNWQHKLHAYENNEKNYQLAKQILANYKDLLTDV